MNEVDWLKSLDRGDASSAHDIDVANSVMRSIRSRESDAGDAFVWPALFATVAGVAAVVIAFQLIVTDPFAGWLDAFNLVLQ